MWVWPAIVAVGLTLVTSFLMWLGLLKNGYFSPYVAAVAAIAARICVRAGIVAAITSILLWNFFVLPPTLAFNPPSAPELTAWAAAIAAALLAAPRLPRDDPPSRPTSSDGSGSLPFVRKKTTPNGIDHTRRTASCWDVQRTGDWSSDDHYGREMGRMWVDARQRKAEGLPPLSFILLDMIEAREFSGVEAGFANAVERAVACGNELPINMVPASIPDYEPEHLRPQS